MPFRSTYRLQLQKNFPLKEAAKISSYLDDLGISHLYLSPILESRAGSNHGYDAIDPTRISDERGGEAAFDLLMNKVEGRKNLKGIILDIVPNHVAASTTNPYWWSVLRDGEASPYWRYFDIRARQQKGRNPDQRVVLPTLGRSRKGVLASRELRISVAKGELVMKYYDSVFPIAITSYPRVLRALVADFNLTSERGRKWRAILLKFADAVSAASGDIKKLKAQSKSFADWLSREASSERALQLTLRALPLKVVEATLDEQNYALEEWKAGSREVNYRRFFDINDLAAIRVEDAEVFKWAHSKIKSLMNKYPLIHGLRVDHVDGLTDPEQYLNNLNALSKNVWVEKILGEGEKLPSTWKIRGSTGYEFSGLSSRLFVALPGLLHLHAHYTRHVDRRWERFHECVYDSKREMLESHFVSELNFLVEGFYATLSRGKKQVSFTKEDLHEALTELTASLKVYRSYFASGEGTDLRYLHDAFAEVEGRGRLQSKAAFNWLRSVILEKGDWSEQTFMLIKRWEQLTGPVMAKGLEDTALYRYFPLLSLNTVGGEPDWVGDGAVEFHAFNLERLRTLPLSMNTTSTHDTKRSEDVRSRIHVLSEISEEWTETFEKWRGVNAKFRAQTSSEAEVPSVATEYLIYETLVGAWPFDDKITPEFIERMKQYFTKAVREAKSETSWTEPNEAYESALMKFVEMILTPSKSKEFISSLKDLAHRTAYFGALNSLSLITLKACSPGVPDFYQGCEMWDLSLVDPDNRRPVDYELRHKLLKSMKPELKANRAKYLKSLSRNWKSGEIKLWLTSELLNLRQKNPALFTEGEYFALEPKGDAKAQFVAFARNLGNEWMVVVVPRQLATHLANASSGQSVGHAAGKTRPVNNHDLRQLQIPESALLSAEFTLPPSAPTAWKNVLTGEEIESATLLARDVFGALPVAILLGNSGV